jgi:hypothetical protein
VEVKRKRKPRSFLKSNLFLYYFLWMDVLIVKQINPLGRRPRRTQKFQLQKLKRPLLQRKKPQDSQR